MRLFQAEAIDEGGKALAVFSKVDGVGRRAEDRDARLFQRCGEFQRRLPAELDNDPDQLAPRLLHVEYLKHVLDGKRLEV